MHEAKFRALKFGVTRVKVRNASNGVQYVEADQPLPAFPERLIDKLPFWAGATPNKTFMARRAKSTHAERGEWEHLTYHTAWQRAQSIAQGLLDRGLSLQKPVAIICENSLDHAQLALGCMVAGVPFVPVSPPYALVSQDYEKLRHVLQTVTPGMVFVPDARYKQAVLAAVDADVEVVLGEGEWAERDTTPLAALAATPPTAAVAQAMAATNGDTVVKFLFTSGSTKMPKGVINTNRMWCANQQQMVTSMPVLGEEDLVLVDWLPWNHTFGGNHNFGMVLFHGGTMYIDDGKPTPALMGETLGNLREIAPTVYFNVPTGFEAIANAMQTDDVLRRNFLSRVKMFFYSGAALAQPIWDSLFASAEREVGERIVMGTGLGMTESGPFAVFVPSPQVRAGDLGVPTPGLELKLVPVDGKTEVRYRGPNITPGYWRNDEGTAEAFDEEGFFKTGDAVLWIDQANPNLGIRFDGRIAEDFKLATGTFVSVGPLRAKLIGAGAPYIQDAVITGLNRHEVGAMVFPTAKVRELAGVSGDVEWAEVLRSPKVHAFFQNLVNELAKSATGSANRVARLCLLAEPPTIDLGEVTDKGSINQRAVLKHRNAVVEGLYDGTLEGLVTPQG
jgi:feruloyl-CoA synthase